MKISKADKAIERAFKEQIVSMANATSTRLTSDFASVRVVCDGAELVFAVWPDASEDDGVGMLIVKGGGNLKFITQTGVSEDVKIAAIPCVCSDQAVALQQVLSTMPDPAARQ